MEKTNIHANHRERMRKRFERDGLSAFEEHEILEMLLFSAIPRRNTNDIAHDLIERFGDIPGVLSADPKELTAADGVGDTAAGHIRFIGETMMAVNSGLFRQIPLTTAEVAAIYATLKMRLSVAESAAVAYTDGDGFIICEEDLYKGDAMIVDDISLYITDRASELCAAGIVLMHNHKGEPTVPSIDDTVITDRLRRLAADVGIKTVMHIIVSDEGYICI